MSKLTLNLIKNEIKDAFIDNKSVLLIATLIFLASLILGYFLEPYLYHIFNPVVQQVSNNLKEGIITLSFHDIFLNNISILFRMYLLGIVCCISAITLSFNGFFLGYYIGTGSNLAYMLALIIPHGIFEVSSCIIGCGAGFVLFIFIYNIVHDCIKPDYEFIFKVTGKNYENEKLTLLNKLDYATDKHFKKLKQSLILLAIAIILMIIAGFIEVYVTIGLAHWIFSIF